MSDRLEEYRKKRDFRRTPEPADVASSGEREPVFVVHRHEARNLHYDLRLEVQGALRSWAVPKGFSYDPGDKRLAVQTEDHPLAYEHFSGRIPKGEYGAGTMTIWDRGTYELVKVPDWDTAMRKGEVKVLLRGRRLRGEWHLVKTKGGPNHWLLFKSKDRYAGPGRDTALGVDLTAAPAAQMPSRLRPMRCKPREDVADDPEWLFEVQFEGRRMFAHKRGTQTRLRGLDVDIAPVLRALSDLRAEQALLDGVLVALDEHERPDRTLLEDRLRRRDVEGLHYYAFDLLHWEDYDLRRLPLLSRKAALRAVLPASPSLLFVDHVAGNGSRLAAVVASAGLPGIVAKRSGSAYRSGPSDDWLCVPLAADAASEPVREALTRRRAHTSRTRVKLTNPEKVYWPAEGYTKGDLVAYYRAVAGHLLPHLADRPIHLNRYPDGIEGKSFYQRRVLDGTPDWVRTVPIEHDDGVAPQIVCDDLDTLLFLVNLGSIDLHPWLSRVSDLDSPDFAVLDLDAKQSTFGAAVTVARAAGRLLRGIGIRPCVKTSGKTGLHVYVPLVTGYSYDHARMFCEGVARTLCRDLPEIATVDRNPANRGDKVYADFLQNRRSQTVVPPYAARPVPGACVSAPLDWDELDSELSPSRFTIRSMPDRLDERGDLFRAALTDKQDLLPAIEALQQVLREG